MQALRAKPTTRSAFLRLMALASTALLTACASSNMRGTDLCSMGSTCVTVVLPPLLVSAGGVRNVAVSPGRGSAGETLAGLFAGRLATVMVDGSPHYRLLPVDGPGVQGLYVVTPTAWQVADSAVTQSRFRCLDKKCNQKQDYNVSCTLRRANVGVEVRLGKTVGTEIGMRQASATADSIHCQGDGGALATQAEVLQRAADKAMDSILDALTVRTVRKRVRMMDDAAGIEDPGRREKFRSASAFLEAGRLDRACPVFEELAEIESRSVSVFYNLGFCAQAAGDWAAAFRWYSRADAAASKPLPELATALDETRPYSAQHR